MVIIYQQIQFIQNTNPGFNKDNVIRFDAEGKINGTEATFVDELKKYSRRCKRKLYVYQYGRHIRSEISAWTGPGKTQTKTYILKSLAAVMNLWKRWTCNC